MDTIADMLRAYEDEVLVPLVEGANLEPVRDDRDFTMFPGSIVALVNGSSKPQTRNDVVAWKPLTVIHMDGTGTSGDVYRLEARFRPDIELVEFTVAEICGIFRLERRPDCAAWIDPLTHQKLLTYPADRADRVLMHSWYLFQGAILPLLRRGGYRFVEGQLARAAFQRSMIHHMAQVYREVV
jgi:hypothetical protein